MCCVQLGDTIISVSNVFVGKEEIQKLGKLAHILCAVRVVFSDKDIPVEQNRESTVGFVPTSWTSRKSRSQGSLTGHCQWGG